MATQYVLGLMPADPASHPLMKGIPARGPRFMLRKEVKKGKERLISAPNGEMRKLQERFLDFLRKLRPDLCKRLSPLWNAYAHTGNRYFFQLDIHSAFRRVDFVRLANVLCAISHRKYVEYVMQHEWIAFLERYCRDPRGGLATGAHSSPDLFELYCEELIDVPLLSFCREHKICYTRYVDDLTFSAPRPILRKEQRAIRRMLEEAGLPVNDRKVALRNLGVGPVTITGYVLTPKGAVSLPKSFLDRAESVIKERENRKFFAAEDHELSGVLGRLRSIDPKTSRRVGSLLRRASELVPASRPRSCSEAFSDEWFRKILDAGEEHLVEIISRYVPLTRRGAINFFGLCPFHNEKTPSFSVSTDKGFFHCFGCGAHGDALDFIVKIEGIPSFREAVVALAERLGLPVPANTRRISQLRVAIAHDDPEGVAEWERVFWKEGVPVSWGEDDVECLAEDYKQGLLE